MNRDRCRSIGAASVTFAAVSVCAAAAALVAWLWFPAKPPSPLASLEREGVILQKAHNDCGVAALATLASRLGKADAAALAKNVEVRGSGLSLLEMSRLAASWGILTRTVFVDPARGPAPPTPWIAHLRTRTGHYVVVEHVGSQGWTVADPAYGRFRCREPEFRRRWSGYALILEHSFAVAR